MPNAPLKILPLGGLGEIGMNCLVLEYGDDIVLMDCGIQFPDASFAGVDLLVPDFSYLRSRLDKIRGVVVTHGHDDHVGAIPFLARHVDLDIYCTPFPRGLIEQKIEEYKGLRDIRFHEITPRVPFDVGAFKFDPIRVQHSIIEALGFGIETPVGNLVHTGDFKHDEHEIGGEKIGFEGFEEWGKKGVFCLLSDSTNAERAGHTISEVDIVNSFEGILSRQTGRLIIALFASNIRRIENLIMLAKRLGKKVAFAGRSMHSYTKLAHGQSSMNIPEDTLILLENIQKYPDDKVIILATGSQAEPQSALVRVAQGVHKDIQIRNGDFVIMSSRFIPGNERNITSMIDHLYRAGAEVMYESIHQIHVSGHGFQDELMLMLNTTRPKYFIPIHGEYRHLKKHASLAKQSGVAPENIFVIEDGQSVQIENGKMSLGERFEIKKTAIVEGDALDTEAQDFAHRLSLAKTGIVFAVALRDKHSLELIADPMINFHGLLFREGETPKETQDDASRLVEDVLYESGRHSDLHDILKLELRRFFKKRASHKPVVIPLVLDV